MWKITLSLIVFVAFAACSSEKASSPDAKRYPLKGKVVSVDRTAKKAVIDHEPVEGYMPAMTMEFPIHADWVWEDLAPGAEVRAELVVDNKAKDPYWLENIGIIAASIPGQQPPTNDNFAQIGKPVPDFTLTNQDGKRISLKDFRGRALAITFIYSRCPLPEYCIRMSTNFSDAAKQIRDDPDLKEKIRLLSISFDPENDTPEKLRSYGIGYLGNDPNTKFDVWQLAVGKDAEVRKIADFFGLDYRIDANDKAVINHNLRTAVIGPDGNVSKILAGNDWTAATLVSELKKVL